MSGLSLDEASKRLSGSDDRFRVGKAEIRGSDYSVFVNAPNDLRALQAFGAGQRGPDDDFIIYEDERVSYSAWRAETERLAAGLAAIGVKPGDHVAVAMRNYPEYLTLIMAIAHIGAVSVLINAWWTSAELNMASGIAAQNSPSLTARARSGSANSPGAKM